MKVLICATSIEKTMGAYLLQLKRAGIDVVWGSPESPIGHNGIGWAGKLKWQRNALSALDPKEQVILSDGWDVLLQGPRKVVEGLIPDEGEIVVAGEKNCWPDPKLQIHYPMGPTPWMFVNSGLIAGEAGALLGEIERGYAAGDPKLLEDDQRLWTWLFLTGEKIFIDYNCRLFQTTFLNIVGTELGICNETKQIHNQKTGMIPCFLHCNAGQDWTERELNLMGITL